MKVTVRRSIERWPIFQIKIYLFGGLGLLTALFVVYMRYVTFISRATDLPFLHFPDEHPPQIHPNVTHVPELGILISHIALQFSISDC